jgi:hypothetical protein
VPLDGGPERTLVLASDEACRLAGDAVRLPGESVAFLEPPEAARPLP